MHCSHDLACERVACCSRFDRSSFASALFILGPLTLLFVCIMALAGLDPSVSAALRSSSHEGFPCTVHLIAVCNGYCPNLDGHRVRKRRKYYSSTDERQLPPVIHWSSKLCRRHLFLTRTLFVITCVMLCFLMSVHAASVVHGRLSRVQLSSWRS